VERGGEWVEKEKRSRKSAKSAVNTWDIIVYFLWKEFEYCSIK